MQDKQHIKCEYLSKISLYFWPHQRIHSCGRPVGNADKQQEEDDEWKEECRHDVADGSATVEKS